MFDVEKSIAFWKDKKVIVTGGSGFLGSFIVDKLRSMGNDPFIVRKAQYDLRQREAIYSLFNDLGFHHGGQNNTNLIIIHGAAFAGGIGLNIERPAELFYDNIVMGTQLLHAAWEFGAEKFTTIGTVCAYPKWTPVPFDEGKIWEGYPEETNAPYGLAKKMLLVQGEAYRKQYGFNSIFLMPTNLYGPRDNFDLKTSHVLPALIRKCITASQSKSDHVTVWGTGTASREYLYVEDAADAILLATEHYNKSQPVNLGSGLEVTIKELITKIALLTGFEGNIIWDDTKPDGQPRRCLSTERAQMEFGFTSRTSFDDGLQKTIEWYLENVQTD
jgi:GDP-L-fucose synthase